MQIDMHYYGTYAVARIAGFSPEDARIVATADQFVDDAVTAGPVSLSGRAYMLPTVTSHKPYELIENSDAIDQWRVWLPFHFLPGVSGNDGERRLLCMWGEPENPVAEAVLNLALGERSRAHGLHFLGLVGHVLQDTYAHYGFSGMALDRNRIDQKTLKVRNKGSLSAWFERALRSFTGRLGGSLAEATRLGHASVATFPDLPYLKWSFSYETAPGVDPGYGLEKRDNPKSYYRSLTRLHALFRAYRNGLPSMEQSGGHTPFERGTAGALQALLTRIEPDKQTRCDLWRERIADGSLFPALPEDGDVAYDGARWRFAVMESNANAALTEAYRFNRAARRYLDAVLTEVLPGADLLVL
jgi:hypothetical protein